MRFYSLFFLLFFCFKALAQPVTLIKNAETVYKIIIPVNSTQIERESANQFQKFIFLVTKVKIPIYKDNIKEQNEEVLIGSTNRNESRNVSNIEPDGIIIKTLNSKLVINGGNRKGVLYAVNTLLDEYIGCRLFSIDNYFIPQKSTIELNINLVENPAFAFRTTFFMESLNKEYADWHRMNYFFEGRGSFAHTLSTLLPPNQYFKRHPEYFAMVNGKRVNTQPCLSNNNVLKIVADNLQKQIKKNPELLYWSISPNDGYDYCQCSLCKPKHDKANSYMGTLLPFVNAIAKKFPDKIISTLAYNQSFNAPSAIVPEKNVEIIICLSSIDNNKKLATSQDFASANIRYNINRWQKLTSNLFIWDYTVCFHNSLSPYPNYFNLKPNLEYYKSEGITKVFEQGIGNMKSEFSEMRAYLLAKLMWNPHLDDKKIIDEFLNGFYGEAASSIKQYIYTLSNKASASGDVMGPWENPLSHMNSYLSHNNLFSFKKIFSEAERKVANNKTLYSRVVRERLAVDFAILEITKHSDDRARKLGRKGDLNRLYIKFVDDTKEHSIPYLGESVVTPEVFYQDTFKRYYLNIK